MRPGTQKTCAVEGSLAVRLGETSIHLPSRVGAGAVVLGVLVLLTTRDLIAALDAQPGHGAEPVGSRIEAEAVTVGDA